MIQARYLETKYVKEKRKKEEWSAGFNSCIEPPSQPKLEGVQSKSIPPSLLSILDCRICSCRQYDDIAPFRLDASTPLRCRG